MAAEPPNDRTAAAARESRASPRPALMLAATILASSLNFIDGSVMNVGLPAIERSLHAPTAGLQWAINAYSLPLSALLLFGGALGDRFGHRRLLTLGAGLFALGSAACAAAPTLQALILARGFQGLSAALMLPNSLAVLGGGFAGKARNRAVGLWAAAASIASALGPVLGGRLIDTVGWRAIFLINLPLAAIAIGLALYAIPARLSGDEGRRLDLTGAALATAALVALVWGLTQGAGASGWTLAAKGAIMLGAALALAFVLTEKHLGERAMTPLALFASRPLLALNGLTLLLYGALGGFTLLVPYALITAAHYSATAAGAALLPFPLIMGLLSPVTGDLAGRLGPRPLLIAGCALAAGGCALALRVPQATSYWTGVLPCVGVLALGVACAAAPLTAAVLGSVDARFTGAASGLNSALAQLGGVIVVALLGEVLGRRGGAFDEAYAVAALAGAGLALAAGACVAVLLRPGLTDARP